MNSRPFKYGLKPSVILAAGVALLIVAAMLTWINVSRGSQEAANPVPQRSASQDMGGSEILVATRKITRGELIIAGDVAFRRLEGERPASSLTDAQAVLGHVATADIEKDQFLFSSNVSAEKSGAGLSALVPEGQRAVSIRVSEEMIVGGFLRVGDRVDVLVTLPDSVYPQAMAMNGRPGDKSKNVLLLQNVSVLAIGELISTQDAKPVPTVRTVTVAISNEAASRLALANRLGQITLAVRNPSDQSPSAPVEASLEDLVSGKAVIASDMSAPAEVQKAERSGHRITIYAGEASSTITTSR